MRRPGLRLLAAITAPVAVGAVLLAPSVAMAAPAAAPAGLPAESEPAPSEGMAAENEFTQVSPTLLTPEDAALTLSGTLRNTGDVPLVNVLALPRFSRIPLEQRSDVAQVPVDPEVRPGGRFDEVFETVADVLEPGETRTYTLTVPAELLSFDQAGVYTVGVDIRAERPDDDTRVTVVGTRTVVPYVSSADDLPAVPVGMLWPVAARPAMLPDGTLLDESPAEQLAPGGPLSALLEADADAPVTWVVDPDLLDTVAQMADGYRVASPSGPVDGAQAGSDAAREWEQRFATVTQGRDVWMLPYAQPDFAALEEHDPPLAGQLAQQSLAAAEAVAARHPSGTAGVAWLDGGSVTDGVLTNLAEAGAETVIAPAEVLPSDDENAGALGDLPAGDRDLRSIGTDAGLSRALAGAVGTDDPTAGAVALRQQWVAETAMVALAAARNDTEPELLVAAPPMHWRPDDQLVRDIVETWTSTPWIEPVDLTDTARAPEQAPRVTPSPGENTTMLPEASVDATARLREDATRYNSLLADPTDVSEPLTLATLRSASTGWRPDPDTAIAYARAVTAELSTRFRQVSVTVPESVTLSSRAGSFPLTVSNELPEAVNVRLEVQSDNPDRLRISEVPTQEMGPGEQRLVEVTAEAAANGRVPIQVQLTTDDGRPIGPPVPTVVNATEYGTIGWLIVGTAGILFAAAILRRMLRSRKARRRRRNGSAPDGPSSPAEPALPSRPLDPRVDGALPDLPTEARPTQEAAR